jgi:asparagine synthase (glutamine-hydrolysing)
MCSINIAINTDKSTVDKMHFATKHRGISESFRYLELDHGNSAWICYNHLPTTDKSISGCGFETEKSITFLNGYISNHLELKEKYNLKTNTNRDTEVLALCLDLEVNPMEFNGFFAVVRYDKTEKTFEAITDRYGIKQLYTYSNKQGQTFISSEVKGILAVCPEIELDEDAVELWHYSLGVLNIDTIYKGIKRVLSLPMPEIERSTDISEVAYFRAKMQLEYLWNKSIDRNQFENGPIGVFVSGGIDSGLIAKSLKPDYCFSVDYTDPKFSEIENIKKNSFGENHFSVIVNDRNYKEYSLKAARVLDDPKAGSCYTNYMVLELASKFVTVVYSGAGGDEFFGGYPHRLDKPIQEVIRRNDKMNLQDIQMSHFDYDLLFLKSVLVVEDRMSSNFTMETRYPFLDNDLVNFALSLPLEFLKDKRILKDISGLHEDVISGRKRGFSNPYFTNQEWTEFVIEQKNTTYE